MGRYAEHARRPYAPMRGPLWRAPYAYQRQVNDEQVTLQVMGLLNVIVWGDEVKRRAAACNKS